METWENESWKDTGHANVWAPMTLDEERGLLYMPVSTPANDYYGGERKGDNLFADSLVCLDANTGKRVWHFQTVHHDLWDYDGVMTPNLVTIRVDGKTIDAVAAVSKPVLHMYLIGSRANPCGPSRNGPSRNRTYPERRRRPRSRSQRSRPRLPSKDSLWMMWWTSLPRSGRWRWRD